MKHKQDIKEKHGTLSPEEINNLENLIKELEIIIETNKITEDGLIILENIFGSFQNFKRNYSQRLVNLLKQGHMID